MAYQYYQPNPLNKSVGDCVIRALCKALDDDWYSVYSQLTLEGYVMCDMPSSNAVWGRFLIDKGYERYVIPNTCPDCYTIEDFCRDNPVGTYIVCTGSHVATVIDSVLYDSWQSSSEVPVFYYRKEENNA